MHKRKAGPQIGGTQCLTKPRSDKEGVPEQRVVPDFGWVKTAELKQREKREYINKERKAGKEEVHQQRMVPVTGRVKNIRAEPTSKEGVHQQGWCQTLVGSKVQKLKPRAKRECIKMESQLGGFREQS